MSVFGSTPSARWAILTLSGVSDRPQFGKAARGEVRCPKEHGPGSSSRESARGGGGFQSAEGVTRGLSVIRGRSAARTMSSVISVRLAGSFARKKVFLAGSSARRVIGPHLLRGHSRISCGVIRPQRKHSLGYYGATGPLAFLTRVRFHGVDGSPTR